MKKVMGSLIVFSAFLLAGCGGVVKETVKTVVKQQTGTEEGEAAAADTVNSADGAGTEDVSTPDAEGTKDDASEGTSADSTETDGEPGNVKEGFQLVGDDTVGWFKIPEDFIKFIEQGGGIPNGIQYATPDGSLILTAMKVDTADSLETIAAGMVEHMTSQGPSVMQNKTTVNGSPALVLFQHFPSQDLKWYVHLVDEGNARKYISIEYAGDQEDLKNQLLEHYSPVKP
ncbi:hypothetical protein [Bacillus sp. REN3]|uniref:hypothetical protein n=1 Tax=Bacillus sp. REN3 TaxID=2802440 RepID=UPI001AEEDF77|nr:hypothetical protein [Bacillus sp. REN3]